ncbi:selenocysteine lyase/cysteine desulfurase [Rubricella aquisinus]|uniref:Selenocysteine lyase/cysteine desulfurase n=1 Tax=Rubricella aquisinus TaxID=2028108 RepID=A0A840X256_9RHOB|nr:aminotransferase class V-fold PLP-dependent enzyme [Rubricella aquisinus]MBB5516884.1 selenocysteine lyase/cysteine desulfurase [Rubricella aquisinus]
MGWEAFRAGFPMLAEGAYLATAGGAPISDRAAAAGRAYFDDTLREGDAPFARWLGEVDAVRAQVAKLIHASPNDIAFVGSASAGMNILAGYVAPGAHIVSVVDEFPSVTQPFLTRRDEVTFAEPTPDAIADAMRANTGAIVVSHVQFRSGRRLDLAALARIAHARGALLLVDATQSMGAVPLDVGCGADAVVASCYKWLCAGYGAGVVYLSPRLRDRPSPVFGWRSAVEPYGLDETRVDATPSAVRLEMGHPPFAPILCLGGALTHLEETLGFDGVWPRIAALDAHLRAEIARLDLPAPITPPGQSGIAVFPRADAADVKAALAAQGIRVTASGGYLRLSFHAYCSEADITAALTALAQLDM